MRLSLRPRRRERASWGATLVELMVALAVLGVVALLAGPAFRPEPGGEPDRSAEYTALVKARLDAVSSGTTTRVRIARGKDTLVVTLLPDGRVLGFGLVELNALTGRPVATSEHEWDGK